MVGETRFGGMTRGGAFGLVLVVGFVIGIFFLPEIIQFSTMSGGTTKNSSVATRTNAEPVVGNSSDNSGGSNFDARSSSTWGWWSDVKGWFSGFSSPRLAQVAKERESSRLGLPNDARASLSSVSQRLDGSRQGQATWAMIRSQESRDAVGQARRDAFELSRGIPSSASASKFAMIDFANGLDFVMTKADQQMTPRDAIVYLMKLDQAVSRALAEDRVDRVYVKRWSQITLGPVLGRTMLGQRHDSEVLPFDPQLTLTSVQIVHKGMRRGDPNTGKIQATISGYLIGDGIKSVVLETNEGGFSVKIPLQRDPRGFWFFSRGSIDARKNWTFKVFDKFGERYQKMYQFYPKASAFRYDSSQGYDVPYRMARAKVGLFRSQDFDPALDKFFTVASSADAVIDANALYSTF